MRHNPRRNKVTNLQLFSLVLNVMVATGVFTISRTVGEVAGRGAILAIPLAGVLSLLQLLGMYLLGRRFPDQTLPEYAPEILGRPLAVAYLLGYFLLNMALAILVPRNFWLLLTAWIFRRTPPIAFFLPLALVCWNIARRGVVVLSRVSEMLLMLTLPLLLLLLLPHDSVDLDFLRPPLDRGAWQIVKGVLPAYFSMIGFDIFLFVFPFTQEKGALKAASLGMAAVTLFYTVSTLLVIGSLSLERTIISNWPLQTYVNNVAIGLFDRFDVIILMVWTWQVIMTITIPMFTAAACLRGVFPRLNSRRAADIALVVLLVALLAHVDLPRQMKALGLYSYMSLIYVGSLPLLLWLIAVLRKKKGGSRDDQPVEQQTA
ncbi:MAG: GerAB/ArcD/ProY family transporter [Bacillota bacterium]